ncbi:MAG: ATP-grasp fold amidoligase family protein [Thermodesulfobacteriota bacterium]
MQKADFFSIHGYWPNLKKPRTFSEKIVSRMLFDRNPIWTMLSDKIRVREYVSRKIGEKYLVPLLWQGKNPNEIPFEILPSRFVIKTNHGCGYNIIVPEKDKLDKTKTIIKLKKWLGTNYGLDTFLGTEWAYKNISPAVMIESFLGERETVPEDYKFFCYSGRAEFIQVSFDRFRDVSERMIDRDFNPLDFYNGVKIFSGTVRKPDNYKEMVTLAETLAKDFDFIRVDLYNVNGKIFLGELTCYPAGGRAIFIPRRFDFVFGEKWEYNGSLPR